MNSLIRKMIAAATSMIGPLAAAKPQLIFDNAGAIDDYTVAAMVALSKQVDLKLVTIVPADSHKEPAWRAMAATLALLGRSDVEVSASDHEGINKFPEEWRRDAARFNDLPHVRKYLPATLPNTHAVDRLIEVLGGPGRFEILATGPQSNVAEVLRKRPDLGRKISRIYVMGGALHVGGNVFVPNHDRSAEWNVYNDAPAAAAVLRSGVPITLVPLDVTDRVPVTHAFLKRLDRQSSRVWSHHLRRAYELLAPQIEPKAGGPQAYCFWGPSTAAAMLAPGLVKIRRARVRIVTDGPSQGRTVEDPNGAEIDVVTSIDAKKFESWMLETFDGGPAMSEADNPGYVDRMRVQYERTDEKKVVSGALREIFGDRRFARALDIGPGPGEVTAPLAERSDRLTLVELNAEYADELRRKFPRAEVVIDSIHNRRYGPEFDAILYSHGLYYVPEAEWRGTVAKFVGLLKPGGSLFVVMNSDVGDMWPLAQHFWPARPDTKTHQWRNWTEFKKELADLGRITSRALTYHWRFPKSEAVKMIGGSLLAISDPAVLARETPEIERYARRFLKDGDRMEMNVGLEIVEIRKSGPSGR